MLILTRKNTESIHIGDDTVISILAVKGDQVRIGIKAPDDVEINREEVHRQIEKEASLNK